MEGMGEPIISLSEEQGELNISGISMMENTLEYYREIKDKVDVMLLIQKILLCETSA